jgi:hypothetical protein
MKVFKYAEFQFDLPDDTHNDSTFFFAPDPKNTWLNSVEPLLLPRPGTYPTFGMPQIGAMTILGLFGYRKAIAANPSNPFCFFPDPYGGHIENAFFDLFKRLNVADTRARSLYVQRNDGVVVVMQAVLAIPQFATTQRINRRDATFVVAQPPTALSSVDASGTL